MPNKPAALRLVYLPRRRDDIFLFPDQIMAPSCFQKAIKIVATCAAPPVKLGLQKSKSTSGGIFMQILSVIARHAPL